MVSRREFLVHTAAATALMALPIDPFRPRESTWAVVDLGDHCGLRESLLGYTKELCERGLTRTNADPKVVIIPGATQIDSSTAQVSLACLRRGGTVLLESGAAFGDFRAYRDQLREHFEILVQPPVELWPARGIPYVHYRWPISAKVRDFSRVMPLAPQRGTVIARVDDIPAALVRRVGSGTLVVLGSPLGPALWADDAEARRWLGSLLPLGSAHQTWYLKM